jgi:hypothetical protein
MFVAPNTSSGTDTITATAGFTTRILALNYRGFTATGATNSFTSLSPSGSNSLSVTVSARSIVVGAAIVDVSGVICGTVTVTGSQSTLDSFPCQTLSGQGSANGKATSSASLFAGSYSDGLSWTGGGGFGRFIVELKGPTTTAISNVRYNFNSTCVSSGNAAGNPVFIFDYSKGSAGTGGSNCNSADILISKSPINLQVAAGKMLEMVRGDAQVGPLASGSWSRTDVVLRVNGTLPSFTENYDPFDDTAARLIWTVCGQANAPALFPCIIPGGTGFVANQTVYVVHDNTKTLRQETVANDLVVTGGLTYDGSGHDVVVNQVVLNFTGPSNFMSSNLAGTVIANSNNTASQLQFGQDYYLMVKVRFHTERAPNANDKIAFGTRTTAVPNLPLPFQIFSVPSSCTDPANKVACSLPTAQPVFQFNPLDPSSWGNAIIKGLVWVFTVAIGQSLLLITQVILPLIQQVLNFIGNFIGWGNIGTQLFDFASGILQYFTIGLGDALTWLVRLILRGIDLIKVANFWVNFYLGGLLNFLTDLLNVIAEFVIFGQKIVTFLGSSYVLIMILFFLWYDGDEGLEGWYNWFETTKWFAFVSFDFLERMINFGISSITWIFGRIPTLDGTTLPELPTIAIGGGPHFPTFEMRALKEGNFAALFGQVIGVSFLIWYETSGLPGSIGSNVTGTAAGVMAPFVTIFLILISVMGLLFIVNIPAQLARGTFDLNSVTKIESFRASSSRAGGVSGHLTRKHPDRKAQIVVHRGLGVRGFVPHLRRAKVEEKPSPQGAG